VRDIVVLLTGLIKFGSLSK